MKRIPSRRASACRMVPAHLPETGDSYPWLVDHDSSAPFTAATTASCSASLRSGRIGSDTTSFAAASVSGRLTGVSR